jgi:hypothetical protein
VLNIPDIFRSDAADIIKCREDAIRIHPTDIRAAGNEIEECVRNYLRRILPTRFYVTHGHLIDIAGNVSPQLDLIVADNDNLPSLMTTKDGTEYVPIDSVYAIGEIKSSYYKSKAPLQSFSQVIGDIKTRLIHEEVPNTAWGGLQNTTTLRDMTLGKNSRILNRIFAFSFFVDGGDFSFAEVTPYLESEEKRFIPNVVVLMNLGVITRAALVDGSIRYNRYPEDSDDTTEDWMFCPYPGSGSGSLEGNHLGFLYYALLEHLINSHLEPPVLSKYVKSMLVSTRSLMKFAKSQ